MFFFGIVQYFSKYISITVFFSFANLGLIFFLFVILLKFSS